jgi:nicotinate-nucleotide pyrophosphorylase (carboxylating)
MLPIPLDRLACFEAVRTALQEDLGSGDITTSAVVDQDALGEGLVLAREPLIVCGLSVMEEVFRQVDGALSFERSIADGAYSAGGDAILARVEGRLASILTAERVALNFAQRMSGVATLTREFCSRIPSSAAGVRLVDTRKTTPGLRQFEKYAVRVGGGHNHRFGLDDGVMIKDNHIVAAGGIAEAVRRAQSRCHHLVKIQVEVESLEQAREAAKAGAKVLLLDNFSGPELAELVPVLRAEAPGVVLEASGGVSLDSIADIAASGVDVISCGAITHQSRAVDLALEVTEK